MATAIDADTLAGHEFRLDEKQRRARYFLGTAPAPQRRGLDDAGAFFRRDVRGCEDGAWRDRVNQDLRRELERETFSERRHRRLRGVVRHIVFIARPFADRQPIAEIEDAS